MVLGSLAYWCDVFIHVTALVKITHRFFTDSLEQIEDAPICNVGVIRYLTQCGDAKYIIFLLLSFSFRGF